MVMGVMSMMVIIIVNFKALVGSLASAPHLELTVAALDHIGSAGFSTLNVRM